MSLYSQFSTNQELEVEGAWFSYPQPDGSVVELLLARSGGSNTPYKRTLRKILRKHAKAGDTPIEQYPPALDDVCQAIADHVLRGWRTVALDGKKAPKIEDDKGKMVSYTPEAAKALVRQLPELRMDITQKSSDFRNYQDIDPEEIEGKLIAALEWRLGPGKVDEHTGERRVDRICEQLEDQGQPIPERLLDPLAPEAAFFMTAWQQLRADAPIGAGFTPIPWSAIYSYADAYGELGDLDLLVRLIWALDRRMGQIEADKRKVEEARNDRSRNPNRPGQFGSSSR